MTRITTVSRSVSRLALLLGIVVVTGGCSNDEAPPSGNQTAAMTTAPSDNVNDAIATQPTAAQTVAPLEGAPPEDVAVITEQLEQSTLLEAPADALPPVQLPAEDLPLAADSADVDDPAAADAEVQATNRLYTDMNAMVASLVDMLPIAQADAFREEQNRWLKRGFRCPRGPEYNSCAQYHINKRMDELRHRVQDVTTSAEAERRASMTGG